MRGIGSIHAQAVAMRVRFNSDRRIHDLGNQPERRFHPLRVEWNFDGERYTDRRRDHEFAAAIQAVREAERAPLVRCIREMGEEIKRLAALVEMHRAQSEGAFDVGRATRFGPLQEA